MLHTRNPLSTRRTARRTHAGDSDWNSWSSCIESLSSLGLNGVETDPPNVFDAKMLAINGQ